MDGYVYFGQNKFDKQGNQLNDFVIETNAIPVNGDSK